MRNIPERNMHIMNKEELPGLKYRQIQKIAKDWGIKANQPRDALIQAILQIEAPTVVTPTQLTNIVDAKSLEAEKPSPETEQNTESLPQNLTAEEKEPSVPSVKLNETFEVAESSILTNDEDKVTSNSPKKTASAYSTPTLLNASDRFEQFFESDEHIPVLVGSPQSPPRQYLPHNKSLATVTPNLSAMSTKGLKDASCRNNLSNNKRWNANGSFRRQSLQQSNGHPNAFCSVTKNRQSLAKTTPVSATKRASTSVNALRG